MKKKELYKALNNWLFESEEKEEKPANNLSDASPIIPMDQMATQLSREKPPIEDSEWKPENIEELAAAASAIGLQIPESQISFFYKEIIALMEKSLENNNKPEYQEMLLGDPDIENPISVKESRKRKLKKRVGSFKKGYITNVTKTKHGVLMREYGRRWYKRDKAADKWKQGQPLPLHRSKEDEEWDDFPDDEFVPDVDDLRDFMEETGETDPTKVPGYTEEMAKEFGLADIVQSKVYPTVKGESGVTNKLEREIYPILRAAKNAPQLFDRISSLIKTDFAKATFYESMLNAKLLDKAHIEDLKKDEEALVNSEMFKYVVGETIITPALKELKKYQKSGEYDPMSKKSQISPEIADAIIEKVRKRWNGMTKARKANDARKAMQSNLEFLSRDTSVMG